MAATAHGAKVIQDSLIQTRNQVNEVNRVAATTVADLDAVIRKLYLRQEDGEPPKVDRIPALSAKLAQAKSGLSALSEAITVLDEAGYNALAETPEPEPEPEPTPEPEA